MKIIYKIQLLYVIISPDLLSILFLHYNILIITSLYVKLYFCNVEFLFMAMKANGNFVELNILLEFLGDS